jgi:ribonuclease HI
MKDGSDTTANGRSWWIRARFKRQNKVWAQCDREGTLLVQGGRVSFRYKLEHDREYTAHESNLEPLPDSKPTTAEAAAIAAVATGTATRPPRQAPRKERAADAETVVIYTDGACSGNPGPAGSGVLLTYKGKEKEISHYIGIATNNIAELYAVKLALEAVQKADLPIDLYTDSTYVIGVLQKGWKAKENVELIAEIRKLMTRFDDLRLRKVKGHAGIGPNERVDALAREAVERRR